MEQHYQTLFEGLPISIWEEDWTVVRQIVERLTEQGISDLPAHFRSHPDCLAEMVDRIRVIDVNQATVEMFGATDKSVFFEKISSSITPNLYEVYAPRISAFASGITRTVSELQRCRLDSSTFDARVTVEVSGQHLDSWRHVYVVVEDITEQNRSEQVFRQSQALAALGRLTGGIAHDFNNLLGIIVAHAELLGTQSSGRIKELDGILGAASRGSQLIQRLLSFARQQSLIPQAIDLADLVVGMEDMLRRTLSKAIRIETHFEPGSWLVLADRSQLENALLNLALNARDAMPKGGCLRFEITETRVPSCDPCLAGELSPGLYRTLTVRDSGMGIAEDVLEQVFEPFFTTKGQSNGTGLGLSMVYGFAKQSNGHVAIDSRVGGGTTVTLHLPEAKVDAVAVEQNTERTSDATAGRQETIAVVEDDPELRELVVSMLETLGYRVMEAGDGAGADAILLANPQVDLLLSDVALPGPVSGAELATDWRKRRPGLAILLMSGFVEVDQRDNLWDIDLLHKPFTRRELAEKLRHQLLR